MTFIDAHMGVYWDARREPLEACADRLDRYLALVREHGYDRYYPLGRSKKEAMKRPMMVDRESLAKALMKGRSRTDFGHEVMEDLGFRFRCWSGHDDDDLSYSISVHCGMWTKGFSNSAVLGFPEKGPQSLRQMEKQAVSGLFRQAVTIWDAETGRLHVRRGEVIGETTKQQESDFLEYAKGNFVERWDADILRVPER